jgi:hypothetical protein
MTDLLEHVTRLLEREPTRCLSGEALYTRARRDTAASISLNGFISLLDGRPERFRVIRTDPVILPDADWSAEGPVAYRAAMAAVRSSAYLVMLTERPTDEPAIPDSPERAVLADAHAALADVLRAAAGDEALYRAACEAVQELEYVRRRLEPS